VLPQLGGKISELTDLRSGREWLWENPYLARRLPGPGMDYERELDSGGWDEVLFSVKPCSVRLSDGRALSIDDHGALIGARWDVDDVYTNSSGAAVLDMRACGRDPAFEWRRRVTVDSDLPLLTIDYTLTNTGDIAWPWLWCAHPLIAIDQGMRIGIEDGQSMRREGEPETANRNMVWPVWTNDDGAPMDLSGVFGADPDGSGQQPLCVKIYVRSGNRVSVSTADGSETLVLEYDRDQLPWLGLWINRHGWSGCGSAPYLNLGVEPATSPFDFLTDAIDKDAAEKLEPGESRQWSLQVNLERTTEHNA
jgi:hypothetical protein